jgi:hypothetical protein
MVNFSKRPNCSTEACCDRVEDDITDMYDQVTEHEVLRRDREYLLLQNFGKRRGEHAATATAEKDNCPRSSVATTEEYKPYCMMHYLMCCSWEYDCFGTSQGEGEKPRRLGSSLVPDPPAFSVVRCDRSAIR